MVDCITNKVQKISNTKNTFLAATNVLKIQDEPHVCSTVIEPYQGETRMVTRTVPHNVPIVKDTLSIYVGERYIFMSSGWSTHAHLMDRDENKNLYVFDRSSQKLLSSVQTTHGLMLLKGLDHFCCSMVSDTNSKILYFAQHSETYGLKIVNIKFFQDSIMDYFVVRVSGEICVVCAVQKTLYIFDDTGDMIAKKNFNAVIQSLDFAKEQNLEDDLDFFLDFGMVNM